MGHSCLSLITLAALVAASAGTHGSMQQVEAAISCPPLCRKKIAEAEEKCEDQEAEQEGDHDCFRKVLGEDAELCEEQCLKPFLTRREKEKSPASSFKQVEAEKEAFPPKIFCLIKCAIIIPQVTKECASSGDPDCIPETLMKIAKECVKCL